MNFRGLLLIPLLAAACLAPAFFGWLLRHRLARVWAALWSGATFGLVAGAWMGPSIGLMAASWAFAMGYLGASPHFVPASLGEIASVAERTRRWWR